MLIKAGINIGDGAIIYVHAVVVHDDESHSIVAGVPAKEIRKQFYKELIKELLRIKWRKWTDNKEKKEALA